MMSRVLIHLRLTALVAALAILAMAGATAQAQNEGEEISASLLAAALDTVRNGPDARRLDDILPGLSLEVQNQLIQLRPDLHKEITDAVEAVALKLAARRSELDNDLARVWAKNFTEQESGNCLAYKRRPASVSLKSDRRSSMIHSRRPAPGRAVSPRSFWRSRARN
jgi:hypothetical protein